MQLLESWESLRKAGDYAAADEVRHELRRWGVEPKPHGQSQRIPIKGQLLDVLDRSADGWQGAVEPTEKQMSAVINKASSRPELLLKVVKFFAAKRPSAQAGIAPCQLNEIHLCNLWSKLCRSSELPLDQRAFAEHGVDVGACVTQLLVLSRAVVSGEKPLPESKSLSGLSHGIAHSQALFEAAQELHGGAVEKEACDTLAAVAAAAARWVALEHVPPQPVELSTIYGALAFASERWPHLVQESGVQLFLSESERVAVRAVTMPDCDARGIATIAWASGRMELRVPRLFERIERVVMERLSEFGPQDLVQVAWAFAVLQHGHGNLSSVGAVIAKNEELRTLGIHFFDALAGESIVKLRTFDDGHLQLLVWAFSKHHADCRRRLSPVCETLFDHIERALPPQAADLQAALRERSGKAMQELFDRIASCCLGDWDGKGGAFSLDRRFGDSATLGSNKRSNLPGHIYKTECDNDAPAPVPLPTERVQPMTPLLPLPQPPPPPKPWLNPPPPPPPPKHWLNPPPPPPPPTLPSTWPANDAQQYQEGPVTENNIDDDAIFGDSSRSVVQDILRGLDETLEEMPVEHTVVDSQMGFSRFS